MAKISDISDIPTPFLGIDLDIFEGNLDAMSDYCGAAGKAYWPHAKGHGVVDIARLQTGRGAGGICVATLNDAEVMLKGQIDSVMITSPIGAGQGFNRLAALKKAHPTASILQIVDNEAHVRRISAAAQQAEVDLGLLIEVSCGQRRCGVDPDDHLVRLIHLIDDSPNVDYLGLQAYTGHIQQEQNYDARLALARDLLAPTFDMVSTRLDTDRLRPKIVTGGGTGTFDMYEGTALNVIQPGSYISMDSSYIKNQWRTDTTPFRCALFVWTTVTSLGRDDNGSWAVVDAGTNALTLDMNAPKAVDCNDVEYRSGGDSHGILDYTAGDPGLKIGDLLVMMTGHCDTTTRSFSKLYGLRRGKVECEWQIPPIG